MPAKQASVTAQRQVREPLGADGGGNGRQGAVTCNVTAPCRRDRLWEGGGKRPAGRMLDALDMTAQAGISGAMSLHTA